MDVLVIDDAAREAIALVRKHAEKHVIPRRELRDIMEGVKPAVGDRVGFFCMIGKVRVVYSIEDQPVSICRHISVSVENSTYPSREIVETLMREFGFVKGLDSCYVWLELFGVIQSMSVVEGMK